MSWFNKGIEKVDETLLGRIKKVENRLQSIEAEILDIATAQNIIRNKVLKKIQFKNPKDDEEDEPKQKDLYNGVLLTE